MKIINFSNIIAGFYFFALTACTTSPLQEATTQESCPRQIEFDAKLKQIEPVIDSMVPGANTTVVQIRTCHKQKYMRGGYEMVVFVKPNGTVGGTAQKPKAFEVPAQECLQEAVNQLEKYDNKSGLRSIQAFKVRFPDLYSDMDVGPVKWLNCSKDKNPKYFDGWATWVHEVVHDLRDQDCLFNPSSEGKPLCFEMPPTLPDRSVAKIAKMPTKNPNAESILNSIQNTYLFSDKEPPIMLFDEVSGYTQTLNAMNLVMKSFGPDGLYTNGDRNIVLLPLFLAYSLNYLDYLKKDSPKEFERLFGEKAKNRKNLKVILSAAENSYLTWEKANSCKSCIKNDFENNLWSIYLKKKKDLFSK